MKQLLFLCGMLWFAMASAQTCEDCRYLTDLFNYQITDTILFGEGLNIDGDTQKLYMDIYEPVGDTLAERPVLMFVFGGGFIQGDRFEKHVTKTCERFAKAGYVAVAMDYRIGIDWIGGLSNPQGEGLRLFYRSVQDLRAATQYMYYSAAALGNPYRIDTTKIFVGGASSGGIACLMSVFGDTPDKWLELADTSALSSLGGYYSTSANGPHAAYGWNAIGIVNIAGAIPRLDWIDTTDTTPIISAHGDADQTVPYDDQASLNLALQFIGFTLQGSHKVDIDARSKGICSYLYTMEGEDHPSNSKSDYYFENVYNRIMPRMKAVMDGQSFCCSHSVTITGDTLRYVEADGDSLNLSVVINGGGGMPAVQWCSYPCADMGYQADITVYPEPGNIPVDTTQYYTVLVTDSNCVATDYVAVRKGDPNPPDTSTAISVIDPQKPVLIYPNPALDYFTVKLAGQQSVNYTIVNMLGQLQKQGMLNPGANRIDIARLQPGVYTLQLGAQTPQSRLYKIMIR